MRYLSIVIGGVSVHFYVTLGFYLYMHYSAARKVLLKVAFEIEAVQFPPRSIFAARG